MRSERGPAGPEMVEGLPVLLFEDQRRWDVWLGKYNGEPGAVWLKLAKKGAPTATVSYAEAVDSAICFGWIDAKKQRYDDLYFLQKFSPRRPRSIWSKVNREKATALIEAGRMMPPGQRAVDEAKASGRWDAAYDPASTAALPPDFQKLLDGNAAAKAFFATLRGSNRYAILYRIQTAKKPETRAKRMARFLAMLEKGETIYPA